MVDGSPVSFETSDARLDANGESFASAFLIPALAIGARLHVDAPLSRAWLEGARRSLPLLGHWWSLPALMPSGRTIASSDPPPAPGVGLCFSLGIDSFHTLCCCNQGITHLVSVIGYDIGVDDVARAASFEAEVRAVAAALGIEAIIVRTDLRDHPVFAVPSWERTHGAALAAVGHLLRGCFGKLDISSSWARVHERPWGSHWDLDSNWGSESLAVVHVGAELRRRDKVREVGRKPLARRYLRVCWEHRTAEANCSACQKCLRTMLLLEADGALAGHERFDRDRLVENLDRLEPLDLDRYGTLWEEIGELDLPPETAAAVGRLMARSRSARP